MAEPAPGSREAQRSLLARHLAGRGVELGPGHVPFPVPYPGASVRYVDRWEPDENRALFRELGDDAPFPVPDVVCNLDVDGLGALDDASEDFVIASHVLEHVANPLALLTDIHRVLRPGGVVLILLPDRRLTFDRDRLPTPLAHLVDEHERGVHEVDDDHVEDFLVGTCVPIPDDPEGRAAVFDLHRRRSIHVHCWHEQEFFEVLLHGVTAIGHRWELVDAVLAADEGEDGFEFGWVLRRTDAVGDPEVVAERLRLAWRRWYDHRVWWHGHVDAVRALTAAAATAPTELAPAPVPETSPAPGDAALVGSAAALRTLLFEARHSARSRMATLARRRRSGLGG